MTSCYVMLWRHYVILPEHDSPLPDRRKRNVSWKPRADPFTRSPSLFRKQNQLTAAEVNRWSGTGTGPDPGLSVPGHTDGRGVRKLGGGAAASLSLSHTHTHAHTLEKSFNSHFCGLLRCKGGGGGWFSTLLGADVTARCGGKKKKRNVGKLRPAARCCGAVNHGRSGC